MSRIWIHSNIYFLFLSLEFVYKFQAIESLRSFQSVGSFKKSNVKVFIWKFYAFSSNYAIVAVK